LESGLQLCTLFLTCLSEPRQHLPPSPPFSTPCSPQHSLSIVSKSYYNEKEARDVCEILFKSIGYIHERSIAHRDLKPENLLLLSEDDDSQVKIADFGFAKKCLSPNSLTTQCGTPGYVAPEILEGVAYDTKSDMWSLGVIIYILLGGYPPFIEQNQRELFRKIRRGQYEFHEEYWGSVSADAKDLISKLLTVDPAKRLSAEEALKHKWMVQDGAILAAADLGTNLTELRKYNAKRKFKAAVNAVSDY
jgi:serine/threonine protein kinase